VDTDQTNVTARTPGSLSGTAWQRIEDAVQAALPGEQAATLLDEIHSTLADEGIAPGWVDLATEKALLEQEVELASSVDPLTGLRNRSRFFDDLRREFAAARRYDHPLSLLTLDVDGLTSVNETQGFDAGDRLLLVVSELLLERLRVSDIAARIGDDDFAVILPHTPLDGARVLAGRIRESLGDWIHVGAASLAPDVTSPGELLQLADRDLVGSR
jgi:diguanylate cyclase (GGDEF)-like protein